MPLPLLPSPRQRGVTILLLATDLDGTFLGGRQADRLALYRAIRAASDVRLVFVTGRGVESVIPLLGDALVPDPEFIIADVGATIVATDGLRPVDPIQWEIDSAWVGAEVVLEAIGEIEGLERQPVPQERRVSFHASRVEVIDEVRRRLEDLPVDLLHSADRYLDVLPRGVNKGSTLMRLVEQLRIPGERVLVAGDTLNDLSLFETGYHGVVVGQSEAALVNATAGSPRVLHAATPGAGGILEALRAFDARKRFAEAVPSPVTSGDAQLVVVYHRLPFDERMVDNQLTRRRPTSPNGIIPTLLGCFEGGRPGSWVAWSTQHAPGAREVVHELVDEARYPNLLATKLPLSEDDVRRFYKEFSKEAFWPVIFSFVDKARFRADEWEHYVEINQRFAEATAAEADEGARLSPPVAPRFADRILPPHFVSTGGHLQRDSLGRADRRVTGSMRPGRIPRAALCREFSGCVALPRADRGGRDSSMRPALPGPRRGAGDSGDADAVAGGRSQGPPRGVPGRGQRPGCAADSGRSGATRDGGGGARTVPGYPPGAVGRAARLCEGAAAKTRGV
jgi:HAD superfamily hydrolase (TIGR01484 family)